MERLQEEYLTLNGDDWQVWFVIYPLDRYSHGGRDEILQFKRNGREVGHIARQLDAEGRLLQENYHGSTMIPPDARH